MSRDKSFAGRVSALWPARLLVAALFLGAIAVLAEWLPVQAVGACTVISSADSGAGTLREKMGNVTCPTINFSGATAITLSSELAVTRTMTIDGIGTTVVISGNNFVRVFSIGSGVAITIQNVTVTHGNHIAVGGGIIMTDSIVSLNNVVVSNNASGFGGGGGGGGGIAKSGGYLNISNTLFMSNTSMSAGGAITQSFGNITVTNSTFISNSSAISGGAIDNHGILTVKSSTFKNNSTSIVGSVGGAIRNDSFGTANIGNSTFYDNRAEPSSTKGGAIYVDGGTVGVLNNTLSNNKADSGAAIHVAGGSVAVINSILANSIGPDCSEPVAIFPNSNNIIEDGTCSAPISGDPYLLPLANNGGPTETMALAPNSPAIDAGSDSICGYPVVSNVDQRGVARPIDGDGDGVPRCDIGAFEGTFYHLHLPLVLK